MKEMSELDEWKQAAGVEAGLRREFYDRALWAESLLQEAYADHRKQKSEIERLRKALEAAREYLESDVADGFRPAERLTAEIDQVLGVVGEAPK